MAQFLINVIKIFLPIIISGNVLISVCSSKSISKCPPDAHFHYIDLNYPVSDIIRLHNAITDNDRSEIVDLFINKHLGNRKRLLKNYLNAYEINLTDHCRSKLSGDFGNLITSLAIPPKLFIAHELHIVFSKPMRDNYDINCGIFRYHDIEGIKRAYRLAYNVEMVKHFDYINDTSTHRTYYSGNGIKLEISQPDFFCEQLLEASRVLDLDRFTFFIVLSLNDDILNDVDISCTINYNKPLKSLLEELPYGGYREAVSAILNASRTYGDNMLRSD
ncbi:uncharacterized protein LOC130673191 [Microplitis mediator]|uniref:uncharacterized protein LOC130673191 n=1 Tax=Microplitis mediator TaxID=375433 RepID=UPI0025563E4D|nr:uncharacterized protein LOC130673191 [Microplitis mediator]